MGKYKLAHLEHVANCVTCGVSLGLSIAGFVSLIILTNTCGDITRIFCSIIYGTSLMVLYAVSTLYHSIRKRRVKRIFRILDHSAIYLLIAGSYTPFALITLEGVWGWSLFGVIWSLAFMGVGLKVFFVNRFKILSTATYLFMGWLSVVAISPLVKNIPLPGVVWLAGGGLIYSAGVVFYVFEKIPFNHAIWHLFVLMGSFCHFLAIRFYVLPC